jgi:hypothetical protein
MLRLFLRIGDQFYTFSFDQTTENVLYIPDFIDSIRQHKYLPFPQAKSRATLFVKWKKITQTQHTKKPDLGFTLFSFLYGTQNYNLHLEIMHQTLKIT